MELDYDSEADVLHISFGTPRPAVGADMGNDIWEDMREADLLGCLTEHAWMRLTFAIFPPTNKNHCAA